MNTKYVIAVDIGGTKILGALVRADDGSVVKEVLAPTDTSSNVAFLKGIEKLIGSLMRDNPGIEYLGIGIGTAGYVDITRQTVTSMNLGLSQFPLSRFLSQRFGLPVTMDNDCNAGVLGEGIYGLAKKKRHYAYISVGTGVGMGLVLDGHLYRGKSNNAGEIGHLGIDIEGHLCKCYGRGCVENFSSGTAIADQAMMMLSETKVLSSLDSSQDEENLSAREVVLAAQHGDKNAAKVIKRAIHALGYAIRNLNNLLDLELVILGGGITTAIPQFVEEVNNLANGKNAINSEKVPIVVSKLGSYTTVLGAAALISQKKNDYIIRPMDLNDPAL